MKARNFKNKAKAKFAKKYRIAKGDQVVVISGNHKGKQGSVIDIDRDKDRVSISGIDKIKRHVKRGASRNQGGTEQKDAYMHISNVMFFDAADANTATRIGFKKDEDGISRRYAIKTGKQIN